MGRRTVAETTYDNLGADTEPEAPQDPLLREGLEWMPATKVERKRVIRATRENLMDLLHALQESMTPNRHLVAGEGSSPTLSLEEPPRWADREGGLRWKGTVQGRDIWEGRFYDERGSEVTLHAEPTDGGWSLDG